MFSKLSNFRHIAIGAAISLLAGQPVLADDTEIFTGQTLDAGQPNVLFIIDTSGSMGSLVDWTIPYDVAGDYDGDCNNDRLYFVESDQIMPECNSDEWFENAAFICAEGQPALTTEGFYTDKLIQFEDDNNPDKRKWDKPDKDQEDWPVECFADNGLHGDGSSDIEVYAADKESAPFSIDPNDGEIYDWDSAKEYTVYDGNYINYISNPSNYEITRLDVVKTVAGDTLSNVSGINVGLMRFDRGGAGGMVSRSLAPIATELGSTTTKLNSYKDGGNTPLAETMYESVLYFKGNTPKYGLSAEGNDYDSEPSVGSSIASGKYKSPIVKQCQKNFVVLLTDGEPTSDTDANDDIVGLPGFKDATGQELCVGNCLDEVAAYMHSGDLSTLEGDQQADIFTIGFHTDQTLLQETANRGGGLYYTADTAEELTTAFTEILDTIIERDTTFTAPSVAVNTFNRLTHRDELFVSMFRPSNNPHWPGNLKRYRLDNTGGNKSIYDATDNPAIDPVTGNFDEDAKSYWTIGTPDGYDTTLGGFASRLHADRNVYTVTSGATSNVTLSAAINAVHETNSALTSALLDVDESDREGLLKWARGVDATTGLPLNILGDALHSRPVVLSWGGSISDPDITLFYTTNDGYFHAVDPTASAIENMEVFSFIPSELLDRLDTLKANQRNNPTKFYGLDGQISHLIYGDNGNQIIETGERAFIYFGMRRGGRNYYAIEVTDRDNPKLAWTIRGGTGSFAELGQTWSEMTTAKVKINGVVKNVLLFGGGYDTRQDTAGGNVADQQGRAIYMVDALTGGLLWSAANAEDYADADLALTDMTNSIPSDLRVIDMNGDGLHDRVYVGDMAGQLWRFDIHNETSTGASNLVTGGKIADIGTGGNAGNRRIFYPPSVALYSDEYLGNFLSVSFGTGHRANPLGTAGKTVSDRFYMLRDPYVFAPARDADGDIAYATANNGDFLDVTSTLNPTAANLNAKKGWRISLDTEEKVLAKALTADGRVFFTSFMPPSGVDLSCTPGGALGSARLYSVLIGSGAPPPDDTSVDPDPDPDPNPECQGRCSPTGGPIAPEPMLIFTEPPVPPACDPAVEVCDDPPPCDGISDVAMVIGTTIEDPSICTAPVRTYWFADGDT